MQRVWRGEDHGASRVLLRPQCWAQSIQTDAHTRQSLLPKDPDGKAGCVQQPTHPNRPVDLSNGMENAVANRHLYLSFSYLNVMQR